MQPVDREGTFRGVIAEYGTKEFSGGTIAIKFRAELTEIYDFASEQWHPWSDYQQEVYGDSFVVKKDGSINEAAVNALANHAGWDGTFQSVNDATWTPTPCQFKVVAEEYKGKTYFKVDFINGFDDVPGGALPKIDEQKVKGLDARFGSQLRAIAGNKMRNQTPVAKSGPPSPPPVNRPAPPPSVTPPVANDGIPF